MSKKEKSTSVNKKTLGRILKYIKRYSFLVGPFPDLCSDIRCSDLICTDHYRTYGR